MLSFWRKYFPKRQTVELFHKDKRVGAVGNALCDKSVIDVCQFLTTNIKAPFHNDLSAVILTLICCSLQYSQIPYGEKGCYDIIRLYHQVLQKTITIHDMVLVGRILDGTALCTEKGEYVRLGRKIALPYDISLSETKEQTTIN